MKEKFIVDGKEIEGYKICERDYGRVSSDLHFIGITKTGSINDIIIAVESNKNLFVTKNLTTMQQKFAENLKGLFFDYKNKLYVLYMVSGKYCCASIYNDMNSSFLFKKTKKGYKKTNFIDSILYKLFWN